MSSLMTYLFQRLDIKIKTIAPFNHQSLQAEHGIKSLTCILTKHLTGLGQMWTKYLSLAMFAYNTFNSPNLGNYSPYEFNSTRFCLGSCLYQIISCISYIIVFFVKHLVHTKRNRYYFMRIAFIALLS